MLLARTLDDVQTELPPSAISESLNVAISTHFSAEIQHFFYSSRWRINNAYVNENEREHKSHDLVKKGKQQQLSVMYDDFLGMLQPIIHVKLFNGKCMREYLWNE